MEREEFTSLLVELIANGDVQSGEIDNITDEGDGLITVHCVDGSVWNLNITRR